jgi:hypothetical protein
MAHSDISHNISQVYSVYILSGLWLMAQQKLFLFCD